MRGARWLLLVAMAAMVGGVSLTYRAQKKVLKDQSVPKPQSLAPELNSSARQWNWTESNGKGCKTAYIEADDFQQVKDSSRVDLKNVALRLYKPCRDTFDLVKSAAAAFFSEQHRLYSEGDVEITLNMPNDGPVNPDLVSIRSSGVAFDSNGGQADTDRPSSFTFRSGDGQSAGASYDPGTRELVMKKDVEVHFRPNGPHAKPMTIEAASLIYYEAKAQIALPKWGKLTRDQTVVEGDNSVVHLDDGVIRQVTTNRAHGTDDYPNRKLEYAADLLSMEFDENGQVERVTGQGHARLVATSEGSETTVTAPRVDLAFESQNGESLLTRVVTAGAGAVTSKPLAAAGRPLGETHVLRSDHIEMKMRPGGREIETLVTHGPGRLEFLPNQPTQHHRTLDGADMVIAYGPENRIDSFRTKNAKTVTDPTPDELRRSVAPTFTASHEMQARFEPGSDRMSSMEQSGEFTYSEGDRRARALKATFDSDANVMLLETGARVWDLTGSTSADRIRMDQRTGNFTAEGGVKSSRLPDSNQQNRPGMLSGEEPLEAQAAKMVSTNRNRTIHYEGGVNLWQGANRLQANVVDVDREKQTLTGDGNVFSNLWEQPKGNDPNKAPAPVLIVVRAAHMIYADSNRLATYTGDVRLNRSGMQVKARELRAYLADSSADSRLEKAFADGAVEILQTAPDRTRTGTAEHAEYYPDDQKVFLRGGQPSLVDSVKGDAHGTELTYFANDDRLLVSGSKDQPAKGRIRRK